MVFVRSKALNNAIQTVKVEFGTLVGEPNDADVFVVLKELPTLEMMKLKEAQEKSELELMQFFKAVIPGILVEHNLYETESEKMTNTQVADFIFEKLPVTSKVIGDYSNAAFFTPGNKEAEK